MPSLDSLGAVLLLALALDRLFGEPPDRFHPTAWMGRTAGFLAGRPLGNRRLWGVAVFLAVAGLFSGAALAVMRSIPGGVPAVAAGAVILKLQFSWRALGEAAVAVGRAVERGELAAARERLARIVGRETGDLGEAHVLSAAVETAGENLPDSIVSPIFYYALVGAAAGLEWGIAAAVFFRAANTLDAMVGYRKDGMEELGWFSARMDDLLNLVPARVSAVLIVLASAVMWRTGRRSLDVLVRDRNAPESPNSGWPMAALAGGLGVRLEKPGGYVLGDGLAWPMRGGDVAGAAAAVDLAAGLFVIPLLGVLLGA
ncbi:MAG: cobalamin biosynthesis protein CobD [Euryarchaeota archaeon]|nr:cobalamin biosynthesis protein CobD [Euryarchaeota archaeon]